MKVIVDRIAVFRDISTLQLPNILIEDIKRQWREEKICHVVEYILYGEQNFKYDMPYVKIIADRAVKNRFSMIYFLYHRHVLDKKMYCISCAKNINNDIVESGGGFTHIFEIIRCINDDKNWCSICFAPLFDVVDINIGN